MISAVALLALAAAAPELDPCAPVKPMDVEDPDAAAAYVAVAGAELAAGARETAITAYREALRLHPRNGPARKALDELCREGRTQADFLEGTRAMEAGRYRAAAEALTRAYRAKPSPGLALLLAICHYELREDAAAEPLLEEASADPSLREDAALYRGLIAYREGRPGAAVPFFRTAAGDPRLEASASQLLALAREEGPVALSAVVQGLYDTNPSLAPDGTPLEAGGDGAGDVTALARVGSSGVRGPYLRASGTYRQHLRLRHFDFVALGGALGAALGNEALLALGEYTYDHLVLGGTPYLSGHRLLGSVHLAVDTLSAGASYALRWEGYLPKAAAPYSGFRHQGRLDAAWYPSERGTIGVAYQAVRQLAQVPELSFTEHGPSIEGNLRLGSLRLAAGADLLWRDYDAVDPDLLVRRADVYLGLEASAELPLAGGLSAQLVLTGREALSNVADLQYAKLTCALRLSYAVGLP